MSRAQLTPDLYRDLQEMEDRLSRLEKGMRLASAPMNVQVVAGSNEGVVLATNAVATVTLYRDAAKTLELAMTYQPPIDAWWDVQLNVGWLENANAGGAGTCYLFPEITPAPPSGGTQALALVQGQATGASRYHSRLIKRVFPLARGVSYTVRGRLQGAAGTWNYYQGINHLFIQAMAFPRT